MALVIFAHTTIPYNCMHKLILAQILGASLLLMSCLPCRAGTEEKERIVFDSEYFDFGPVERADGPVCHVFRFLCTDDKPVTVGYVDPGCYCISAKWPKVPIVPGEVGEIVVSLDISGSLGEIFRGAAVYLNDGSCPANLAVRAEISDKASSGKKTTTKTTRNE